MTDAVVLDVLPHGRADDERPQYQKRPLAHAVTVDSFRLLELVLSEDADLAIDDRVPADPGGSDAVAEAREIRYEDLSAGATSELEYVVEDLVEDEANRFVDFYNEAGPITLRLHQLDLLPGIGDTLRNNILDQRKRGPFEDFADVSERVSGLHNPREVLVERILEEIREDDMKYYLFAREESSE